MQHSLFITVNAGACSSWSAHVNIKSQLLCRELKIKKVQHQQCRQRRQKLFPLGGDGKWIRVCGLAGKSRWTRLVFPAVSQVLFICPYLSISAVKTVACDSIGSWVYFRLAVDLAWGMTDDYIVFSVFSTWCPFLTFSSFWFGIRWWWPAEETLHYRTWKVPPLLELGCILIRQPC